MLSGRDKHSFIIALLERQDQKTGFALRHFDSESAALNTAESMLNELGHSKLLV